MIQIENQDTDNPTVDWDKGTATVTCTQCGTTKPNWPIRMIASTLQGDGFIFSSNLFRCGCSYTTIFPIASQEPICKILCRLAGL